MNTTQNTSPQILSGTVALASGKMQTISMDAMASRSQRWLRLDELSVAFYQDPVASNALYFSNMMGSLVQIRARAYRQDLMLNYVPTWLLGPRLHKSAEYAGVTTGIANSLGRDYSPFETYRWKFPKPFFLPPGAAFIVQLQRDGSTGDVNAGGSINAQVVVRAAQMSEGEARAAMTKSREGSGNPIPYMAAYTPVFPSANYTNKSNNLDLANPFLTPLQLQRMTGRIRNTGSVQYGTVSGTSVKLSDTRTVICDWTDMLQVFPSTQLAWTHTRILQPAEYITAELKNRAASADQLQVAIIGYRNEVLP